MRNKRKHGEDQSLESMIHQAGSLGMTNNMEAKMTTILEALRCCASKNYMGMEFESNSLVGIIASTVIDSTPFCIFTFDSILLRIELFRKVPSPAPGPAPETSPAPTPDASAPTADASSPTPMMSPPAPPTSSPAGDPEDGLKTDSENSMMAFDNLSSLNTDFLAFIECGLNTSKWKLAVQIASKQQKPVVEDEEIEMEDAEDWSVMDIDSSDKKNELTIVKYIDDIYAYYMKAEVHYKFELMEETLYLTMNLIDRFLAVHSVIKKKLQLVCITALLLACKYEEFNMTVPVTYVFMQRFLKASQSDKKCTLGVSREWNATCEKHSNYDKNQILECSKLMVSFHQKAVVGKLTGVHRKSDLQKVDVDAAIEDFNNLERKAIGTVLFLDCVGSKLVIVSTMILCLFCKSKSKKFLLTN
ncbi:hypothetical protein CQW23_03296 [Capsicum baccatum]|uniref:Cyclin-like domain-containing protein n=1 Tax=Capsicum baccatum TaxID=33114 RepID=A0A2G2XBF3_CAPBA|nr:hypothetical protein CQW23_03296 [Capsicum baccatum]